jgi:hypothetical protein
MGSFEEWSRRVLAPFMWAGLPSPLPADGQPLDTSEEEEGAVALLEAMEDCGMSDEYTASHIIGQAQERESVPPEGHEGPPPRRSPALYAAVRDMALANGTISASKLGDMLKPLKDRRFGTAHGERWFKVRLLHGRTRYSIGGVTDDVPF